MEFTVETFKEIAEMSKQHGMKMFQKADTEHLEAMEALKSLMQSPQAMQEWFQDKRREFEAL